MRPLFAAMQEGLARGVGQKQQPLWRLSRQWPELVGPALALRSLPVKITDKGVLWVRVQDSSTGQELALMKSALLPQLAPFGVTQLRSRVSLRAFSPFVTPRHEDPVLNQLPPEAFSQGLDKALAKRQRLERVTQKLQAEATPLPPPPPPSPAASAPAAETPEDFTARLQAAFAKKSATQPQKPPPPTETPEK